MASNAKNQIPRTLKTLARIAQTGTDPPSLIRHYSSRSPVVWASSPCQRCHNLVTDSHLGAGPDEFPITNSDPI